MNKIQKMILGFTLILIGFLNILNITGITELNFENSFYFILQFLGLVFVFTSMGNHQRAALFIGSVVFMAGVILFIRDQYEILDHSKIIIPSLLICTGAGFFVLYVDNLKENAFLVLSLILFSVSLLLIAFTRDYPSIRTANRVANNILGFWPVLISLVGIGLLLNRNRK